MLTTLMNLEVLVEHILDVGMTMLEYEPSLFHAKNARTGPKGFHRCDDHVCDDMCVMICV